MAGSPAPTLQAAIDGAVAPAQVARLTPYVGQGLAETIVGISREGANALADRLHAADCGPYAGATKGAWDDVGNARQAEFEGAIKAGLEAIAHNPQKRSALLASADKAYQESFNSQLRPALVTFFREGNLTPFLDATKAAYQQILKTRDLSAERAGCPSVPSPRSTPGR